MPISLNSPARNFFLLGSSGVEIVTNFFKTIDQSSNSDGVFIPDEIKYNPSDQKYILSGSAKDSNLKDFGWFEKRGVSGASDFNVRIESTGNTTLRAMELDSNNNLIVVGRTGVIPWIAKYSNGGIIDWQSTTNTAEVEYTGIASDNNGNYYACGSTILVEKTAFVEKFDANGTPGWGKAAYMLGRDVVLYNIAANSRGEVVAVGYLEDNLYYKGYIVKIDTNTGEVLWDRTLQTDDYLECTDVYIDSNDQIYVTAHKGSYFSATSYLIKYTAEGNIIWQRETNNDTSAGETIIYQQVHSDGETEQTIIFGTYKDGTGNEGGILSKYSKDGSLVWTRTLFTTYNSSDSFGVLIKRGIALDADPSFYYLLFVDDPYDSVAAPDRYTFGKVSSSGNGLGGFEYSEGTGQTISYEILSNTQSKIGRLSDGSVRQDSSDLITYPFSANKLLFDDLATQVANKKRQMDDADSFEYSGSPAIRPADFQELNLLGDVYSGSGNWLDQSGKGNNGTLPGMWIKTVGANDASYTSAIDNNYFYTAGMVNSEGQGNRDGYVSKWNFDGSIVWQKIIGDTNLDQFSALFIDTSGNIYAIGSTISAGLGSYDIFISKFDSNGNILWQKVYGRSTSNDLSNKALFDNFENIIISYRTPSETDQGNIVKIDTDGNIIWEKSFNAFTVQSINLNSDNSFDSIFGYNDSTYTYFSIVSIDSNGSVLSRRTFGDGTLLPYPQIGSFLKKTNGNFIISAALFNNTVSPVQSQLLLVELDSEYNIINKKLYTDTLNGYFTLINLISDSHGNIYGTGLSYNSTVGGSSYKPLIYKFNSNLEIEWIRSIDGDNTGFDILYDIKLDPSEEHIYITGFLTTGGTSRHNHAKLRVDGSGTGIHGNITYAEFNSYSETTPVNIPEFTEATLPTASPTSLTVSNTSFTLANSSLTITTQLDTDPTYNPAGYWEFDGVGDYIDVGNLGIDMSQFTVEVWFRPNVVENYRNVIDCNYGTPDPADGIIRSGNIGPRLEMNSAGILAWDWGASRSANDPFFIATVVPSGLAANTWHHTALTVNGNQASNGTSYYNGSVATANGTQTAAGSTAWYGEFQNVNIGRGFVLAGNRYFDGEIGEVRIYPRALTAAQVFQNYNATREKYTGVPASTDPGLTSTRTPA